MFGCAERRDRARLALEARGVGVRREQLQRDAAPELRVGRAPRPRTCRRGRAARRGGSGPAMRSFWHRATLCAERGGFTHHASRRRRTCSSARGALAAENVRARRRRRPRHGGGGARRGRPAAVPELGDGRLRRAGRATCRDGSPVVGATSPPAGPPSGRSPPARRWRSRPAASCPTAPMPSSPSSMLSSMTTRSRRRSGRGWARTFVRAAATSHAGDVVVEAGRAPRRRAARRARGRGSRARVAARGARASPCSRPGTELARPGEPLAPGRGLRGERAHARGSARRRRRRRSRCCRSVADDEAAHRAAIERGLERGRARHVGRRLRRPARSRAADRGRARRRGGLLARRDQAGQAGRVRRARRDARLRPARATRCRRSSAASSSSSPRCARCRGCAIRCRASSRAGSRRRCGRNDARDELVRARVDAGDDGVVLEPLSGQESHMIVRAAAADALVHVPRGDGRARRRSDGLLAAARRGLTRAHGRASTTSYGVPPRGVTETSFA